MPSFWKRSSSSNPQPWDQNQVQPQPQAHPHPQAQNQYQYQPQNQPYHPPPPPASPLPYQGQSYGQGYGAPSLVGGGQYQNPNQQYFPPPPPQRNSQVQHQYQPHLQPQPQWQPQPQPQWQAPRPSHPPALPPRELPYAENLPSPAPQVVSDRQAQVQGQIESSSSPSLLPTGSLPYAENYASPPPQAVPGRSNQPQIVVESDVQLARHENLAPAVNQNTRSVSPAYERPAPPPPPRSPAPELERDLLRDESPRMLSTIPRHEVTTNSSWTQGSTSHLSPTPSAPTLLTPRSTPSSPNPSASYVTRSVPSPTPSAAPSLVYQNQNAAPPSIRKILCLDGGGVRGLSEIIMLQFLMQQISHERGFPEGVLLEPWQEFDMIGGTSTGGIIAIMLGRLRMSVAECKSAYLRLSERIFTPSRNKANVVAKGYDFLQANGKFKSEPLEDGVKEALKAKDLGEETLLWERNGDGLECKVFVCATSELGTPTPLRSYRNPHEYDALLEECRVWEAARATSAASTFFEPITIGQDQQTFVDGALRDNNPIEIADMESRAMFPNQDRMIVSLGTGIESPKAVTGNALKLIETLVHLVVDTELRNSRFREQHGPMVEQGRLYRFNVSHGLGALGLEEYKAYGQIAGYTTTYLKDPDVKRSFNACAKTMKNGGQRLNVLVGDELVDHLEQMVMSEENGSICNHCLKAIPYRVAYYYCFACLNAACSQCRALHNPEHSKKLMRIESRKWSQNMRDIPSAETCKECLEPRRCRISCKTCDWALCPQCKEGEASRFQSHTDKFPDHREFNEICTPSSRVEAPRTKSCSCQTSEYAAMHCSRCSSAVGLNVALYECKTCVLEFGTAQMLCQACWQSEDAAHKSQHNFQTYTYFYERTINDDKEVQFNDVIKCMECHQAVPSETTSHHPHSNFAVRGGAAFLEFHRQWVIGSCPFIVDINKGRRQPLSPVGNSQCAFCTFAIGHDEKIGLCLSSRCCRIFCSVCMRTNRHGHRHKLFTQIYKAKLSGVDLGELTCDLCGRREVRMLFQGLECSACCNMHFCNACVVKLGQGTVSFPNNGVHGCPPSSVWTFHRFAS